MIIQCPECIYWFQEENSDFGQCRRNAPRPKVITTSPGAFIGPYNARAIWPYTRGTDGCGGGERGKRSDFTFEFRNQTSLREERKSPDSFNGMVERAKRDNR